MSDSSVERFVEELSKTVDYYRAEYDLTYAEAVGGIEILKAVLLREAIMEADDG